MVHSAYIMCPGHQTDLNIFHWHSKWIHFNHLCCFWLLCLNNLCRGCNSHWHIHRRPSAVVFWVGSIVNVSNGHRENQSVTTAVNLLRTYHLTYDHTCMLVAGLLNSLLKNIWCRFNSFVSPREYLLMNCQVVVYELVDFVASPMVHCCCGQHLTKVECSEGQIPLEKCYTTQGWGGGGHSGGLSLARLADFRSNTNSSRVFICSQVISRLRHSHTRKK